MLVLASAPAHTQPAAGAQDHFVRVSPRDHRYLELTDGSPFVPIGLNMIAPPRQPAGEQEAMRGFEAWLAALSANGGNYIRVWLGNPFWDVEHIKSGAYDGEKARRIDRLLDLCRRYRLRVKMTMEHFRTIGEPGKSWADKPLHHVSNGGPASSIADFFDGEASRAQFRRKIRWYTERYGAQPIIFAWELWNEIDAVRGGDYMSWTQLMLPELRRAFPRNMVMQSLGSFDRAHKRDRYRRHSTMEGNDVAQVHRYLDLGAELAVCKGPVDVMAADAVRELLSYGPRRPVILAESGAVEPNHTGAFHLYSADKEGIIVHDVLFAPFFAGAAGPGQPWHWDVYVAANNLWHHFARFREIVEYLDPPAEGFQPMMLDHDRLRVYVLKGRRTILVWCRDSQNTWQSELANGERPEVLRGVEIDLKPVFDEEVKHVASVFDPWAGKWFDGSLAGARLTLPAFSRSIIVRLRLQ